LPRRLQHRALPEARVLRLEQLHQLADKEADHLARRVACRQCHEDPPIRVDRSEQTQSRTHGLPGQGVRLGPAMPLPALKVELVNPALVDVDDSLTLPEQLQHLNCALSPHHETALAVALERDALDLVIAHVEPTPQHL
jgi:hypothetical protein